MINILVLEDDTQIAREIENHLEKEGFLITVMKTLGQTQTVDFSLFNLLIFDWNLPDGESIDLVAQIRQKGIKTPILILTANTDAQYREKAINTGVNDFLGKPFYFHELKARLDVLLKSGPQKMEQHLVSSSDIEINKNEISIKYSGSKITTTRKEYELLLFFLTNPNVVFSRNEILDAVWGEDENPSPRTVDTHILNIRKKTKAELFQTVWSSGYRFVPEE